MIKALQHVPQVSRLGDCTGIPYSEDYLKSLKMSKLSKVGPQICLTRVKIAQLGNYKKTSRQIDSLQCAKLCYKTNYHCCIR